MAFVNFSACVHVIRQSSCNLTIFQDEIKERICRCEQAVDMVNMLHLFSSNESIEEIASNELRLAMKLYAGNDRSNAVLFSNFQ